MLESDASILLIAACGLVLFRPQDVPLLARYAGRLVGGGVRGLRGLRHATDAALEHGESVLGKQGGTMGKDLRESLSKFDSLRNTVTRDVARFAPFDRLNGGIRAALRLKPEQPNVQRREDIQERKESKLTGLTPGKTTNLRSIDRSGGGHKQPAAGVDFIARSIEEAALAEQQERIFGGAIYNENQSASASHPDPLDPPSHG